ncbi:helix-turn-helix domain-containing protein [Leadbettera azotonutricia]|uniref:Transcriptional regulator, Cro/CI family n=1 Tax=Leadbettera azotonutricia (strain ATCC BAA-888 / DSM 13862 / ZAS-9) TaxID=545695 RepID=F5YDG1_LEAAZ|nr:helix-turn-helix transcriptional regulator [Leadbettera azotonutricia]AEF83484.1 transcriptional regulator, Cro/CI family [Leadbettera azotonutricia ZAS-9]
MPTKPEEIRKSLSLNIKKHRKRLKISQEKLAEITGLAAQTINDIEGGRKWVSDRTLSKISNAFDIAPFLLLVSDESTIGKQEGTSPVELLSLLRVNLKKSVSRQIDTEIDEIFKEEILSK